MTETHAPDQHLRELLAPILARVAALEPQAQTSPEQVQALEAALEADFPYAGEHVQALGRAIQAGIDAGWLANRGDADARFSRVAKASADTHDLSIDVVSMIGGAVEHTHLEGEVTVGFPAQGTQSCQFEGRDPAWVFLPPGSRHVPTVTGGRMNLIYFLPHGAVEWHFPKS